MWSIFCPEFCEVLYCHQIQMNVDELLKCNYNMHLFTGTTLKTFTSINFRTATNALYCQIEQLDLWREQWTGVKDYTSAKRLVEESSVWGKSEWQAVHGPVQVDVHAWLSCTQTGEMTRSLAKMFTGRCVLKESSLAGHGSGKYPAVQRICNTPLVHGSTYKNPDLLKRNDGEAGHGLNSSFSFLFSLSFSHSLPPSISFFHTIEPLSILGLKANSSPLCILLHITFKSSAGPARAPRLLASVQRFASEVTICDAQITWARICWWLLRRFCKPKPVMCYMMWLETSTNTSKLMFSQHTIECVYDHTVVRSI